ncbi:MAG: hypothetical protein IPK17_21730 [Chloroflexi bacterium]|uniref:nSTAND1 domain-containing NTPase n=1 Tax=Candidatus Flexifilum breve TaxID=3140694 RepID=UPI0031354C8E|nr:hypothetical protein [Chloroflexota bacterium]
MVDEMVFNVRGESGALPLLQFALDQLYQHRSGLLITRTAYAALGGVRGALTKHAEATYAALNADEQKLAETLFVRLIEPGMTEQETTRRRASISELRLNTDTETNALRAVAETFVRARLLVKDGSGDTATVEVAHEALIREWRTLAAWAKRASENAALIKLLRSETAEWLYRERTPDRLLLGARLEELETLIEQIPFSADELEFLHASRDKQKETDYASKLTELKAEQLERTERRAALAVKQKLLKSRKPGILPEYHRWWGYGIQRIWQWGGALWLIYGIVLFLLAYPTDTAPSWHWPTDIDVLIAFILLTLITSVSWLIFWWWIRKQRKIVETELTLIDKLLTTLSSEIARLQQEHHLDNPPSETVQPALQIVKPQRFYGALTAAAFFYCFITISTVMIFFGPFVLAQIFRLMLIFQIALIPASLLTFNRYIIDDVVILLKDARTLLRGVIQRARGQTPVDTSYYLARRIIPDTERNANILKLRLAGLLYCITALLWFLFLTDLHASFTSIFLWFVSVMFACYAPFGLYPFIFKELMSMRSSKSVP